MKISVLRKKNEDNIYRLESKLAGKISKLLIEIYDRMNILKDSVNFDKINDNEKRAKYYGDNVVVFMKDLREVVDDVEQLIDSKYWPYLEYNELLFSE